MIRIWLFISESMSLAARAMLLISGALNRASSGLINLAARCNTRARKLVEERS